MKVFVKDNFLEPSYCEEIINSELKIRDAKIYGTKGELTVNKEYRDTLVCNMTKPMNETVEAALLEIKNELATFYNVSLSKHTHLQLLKYNKGHFFKKHQDSGTGEAAQKRMLTTLIYLNDSDQYSNNEDRFGGGELIVYGAHERFPQMGFPVYAKKGRLVAFPAELMHEVKPITYGSRFCIVSWYNK